MAVAVKNSPQATATSPLNRLAVGSLVGVAYVVASLYVVFDLLPSLWSDVLQMPATFVNSILLVAVMAAVGVGLVWVGKQLAGAQPPHGLRAGIFTGVALLFLVTLLAQGIGITIENMAGSGSYIGMGIAAAVAIALLYFLVIRPFFRPGFEKWLIQFEDQGWFTRAYYKASQGLRVRRGTILGILALVACGIYTLLNRNPLLGDWEIEIPFVQNGYLVLLPYQKYTLTLLLAVGGVWFAWRVVNYPTFADFLIATEAEMNKVSWTTRKRLIQDTIVVLVTVFLLTMFLLVVDVLWFRILSSRPMKVIRMDTTGAAATTGEKQEY